MLVPPVARQLLLPPLPQNATRRRRTHALSTATSAGGILRDARAVYAPALMDTAQKVRTACLLLLWLRLPSSKCLLTVANATAAAVGQLVVRLLEVSLVSLLLSVLLSASTCAELPRRRNRFLTSCPVLMPRPSTPSSNLRTFRAVSALFALR